jgi:hypothetical protein
MIMEPVTAEGVEQGNVHVTRALVGQEMPVSITRTQRVPGMAQLTHKGDVHVIQDGWD